MEKKEKWKKNVVIRKGRMVDTIINHIMQKAFILSHTPSARDALQLSSARDIMAGLNNAIAPRSLARLKHQTGDISNRASKVKM